MAAAIVYLQIKNGKQPDVERIVNNIVQRAKTAGAEDLKACVGKQIPSTQIIETCKQTVAQKAGRTCEEITGWLITEAPETLKLCEKAYKNGMKKAESALR